MPSRPMNPARRSFLAGGTEAVALVALAAAAVWSTAAAGKATKSDFMYQDHGHDGRSCSQCRFFSPDGPNAANGSCAIVAGTISRDGWCAAYAPKVAA